MTGASEQVLQLGERLISGKGLGVVRLLGAEDVSFCHAFADSAITSHSFSMKKLNFRADTDYAS